MMVYCVLCIDDGSQAEVVHIFSTPERARQFCDNDARSHVLYDYVIDCPEVMETRKN